MLPGPAFLLHSRRPVRSLYPSLPLAPRWLWFKIKLYYYLLFYFTLCFSMIYPGLRRCLSWLLRLKMVSDPTTATTGVSSQTADLHEDASSLHEFPSQKKYAPSTINHSYSTRIFLCLSIANQAPLGSQLVCFWGDPEQQCSALVLTMVYQLEGPLLKPQGHAWIRECGCAVM